MNALSVLTTHNQFYCDWRRGADLIVDKAEEGAGAVGTPVPVLAHPHLISYGTRFNLTRRFAILGALIYLL